ncbi:MAG: glycine cleavage system aminomethyltransferase GcvT [Deltaproteobacteria bacterium]|nr:glycine cleavage system aminomethyltransferase GcvT [Deltaproteobacteria bacterium]
MSKLRTTPLHAHHQRLGARMVEFAGFDMPVQYSSIVEEHAAVRERAGLFDVSHMGQIHIRGPHAVATAETLVSCPIANMRHGLVRYGLLCNEAGGVIDDVTVYRIDEDSLFLCVNAANIEKDHRWMLDHAGEAEIEDRSAKTGMLALQGPSSEALMGELAGDAALALKRFRFAPLDVAGVPALVSRTGYTGSGGFEIYLAAEDTVAVFEALMARGEADGLRPVGLGARDTLRLEAALPLYGHELDDATSPLEAGLGRFVKREQGGFIGAEAIEEREARGRAQQLVGFEMSGRGIPRAGYAIASGGEEVGRVTSGAPSPTLGKSIGLGYVPPSLADSGTTLDVVIRGRAVAARVVDTPFVKSA